MGHEDTVRRFCDAINDHDADGAAALANPSIVLVIGPNQVEGLEALRAMANQPEPEGLASRVEVVDIEAADGRYEVAARRVQRWTETNELASEEDLSVFVELDEQGLVTRAELQTKS
jgi:limonene-1,2-epoxide hydrolase